MKVNKLPVLLHFIVFAAVLIRFATHYLYHQDLLPDAAEYLETGRQLWSTGRTSADDMMPLYGISAHLSETIFGMPVIDILLSSITIYFVFGLTQIISHNEKAAIWSAIIFGVWPMSIFYASAHLTETLFVFLFLGGMLAAYQKQIVWCSIFWVLSVLTRPVFDMLYPILVVWFFYEAGTRKAWKALGIYVLTTILLMSPWWYHNQMKYGSFVRLNLGIGYVLYEGNHQGNENGGPAPFMGNEPYSDTLKDPIAIDKALKEAAISNITGHPKRFLILAGKKFLRFWNPLPNHESYRGLAISLLVFVPSMFIFIGTILFFARANRQDLEKVLPFILCMLFLTAIHMMTVASIRYRYPLEPLMMVLACWGLSKGSAKIWRRTSTAPLLEKR